MCKLDWSFVAAHCVWIRWRVVVSDGMTENTIKLDKLINEAWNNSIRSGFRKRLYWILLEVLYQLSHLIYTVIYSHIHSGHGKHFLTLGSSSVKDQNAIGKWLNEMKMKYMYCFIAILH